MTKSKRISGSRRVPYMTQVPGGPSFFDITTEINGFVLYKLSQRRMQKGTCRSSCERVTYWSVIYE
jgi:hypothetical protein